MAIVFGPSSLPTASPITKTNMMSQVIFICDLPQTEIRRILNLQDPSTLLGLDQDYVLNERQVKKNMIATYNCLSSMFKVQI